MIPEYLLQADRSLQDDQDYVRLCEVIEHLEKYGHGDGKLIKALVKKQMEYLLAEYESLMEDEDDYRYRQSLRYL